ncbi:MAG: pyridoxamine 5'-phosphate oxidase family protein [Prevotella sp.]|nr:pyridoxamine 5'-phosphate oxidase family protein [Prevotella sp.]
MSMFTHNDCIEFVKENPIGHMATIDKDQPRVRPFGCWFADKTGFYFQTVAMKEISCQLAKNPKVEVCFFSSDSILGPILRITGEVEFLTDIELKRKVLHDRPYLRNFGVSEKSPELLLFRIPKGKAHFWALEEIEDSLRPKNIIEF